MNERKVSATKSLVRAALAAALLNLSLVSLAQPATGFDAPLAILAAVKAQLNLNTSQQLQWDTATSQAKDAHEAARANFGELKAAMQTELGKAEPDLAAVAATADSVRQQNESLRKAARDAWLALYATFSPEQKAVVRDALKAGIERMAARRGMHGGPAPH